MATIAVTLHTTFTRFEHAKKTILSFAAYDTFKLYISDTGEITPEKLDFYRHIEKKYGYKTYLMGWDTSPAITRNFMVDQSTEPYIFKIDDDFEYIPKKANYLNALAVLESAPNIGLVGFSVRSKEYKSEFIFNLDFAQSAEGRVLRLNKLDYRPEEIEGIRALRCHVTPDCWIAKRAMFPECNWDERYHVSEGLHTDFFTHIKERTNWEVMYLPDCHMYTFKHDDDWKLSNEDRKASFYNQKRFRNLHNIDKFKKKWNVVNKMIC